MLYLVGIGLIPKHLSLEALETIQQCEEILLETYTSKFTSGEIPQLEQLTHKKIKPVARIDVEDQLDQILKTAKTKKTCLLIYGNPLFATTHVQILIEAKKRKIPYHVIAGISIANFLGHTGLDNYRFGRIATIVYHEPLYAPESFFDIVENNQQNQLHSLCLLDIRTDENRFMSISEAIEILEKIATKRKTTWFSNAMLVGIFGAGNPNQQIRIGSPSELKKKNPDLFPQSLIVCGPLNEKEKEAFNVLGVKK